MARVYGPGGQGNYLSSMDPQSDKPKVVSLFEPERMARIKEEKKRRSMPEKLMLWALITVAVLTIAPVGLLALVGY
ncbi:MAG: hypothetical protein MK180_09815 [Rhodobacteraceae bacterium]|nr:hypothetical protein [Paracoccaceae bacterium]